MNQIVTGLKKELLYFWRSYRFLGLLLAFLGSALVGPLTSKMMLAMQPLYDELSGMEGMESMSGMSDMLTMFEGESGLMMSYISSLALFSSPFMPPLMFVLIALIIGGACGGEQKKRSIIVPQTAGLTPAGYVLPKFMIFPPMFFVLTVLSALIANGACGVLLGHSYPTELVFVTGALTGMSLMFMTCMYMLFGIGLAQPKLAIIYVLLANAVFPFINFAFNIKKYTPWSMDSEGMTGRIIDNFANGKGYYDGIGVGSIVATMGITLALSVVFLLLTYFAIVAKRMDNTADEVY
ncbi:MAG: hypothetical protein FWG45_01565 [Oscillospiraceae bacterium]|nr:hypothetical protein [Oscillospiraceae bacterium]